MKVEIITDLFLFKINYQNIIFLEVESYFIKLFYLFNLDFLKLPHEYDNSFNMSDFCSFNILKSQVAFTIHSCK
jgi:hypothetical protein